MTNQTGSSGPKKTGALKRCDDLIDWYELHKSRQRVFDSVLQTSVILAAGLTPFAAAIESWPKWAIVLPAVITTVATGLSMNFWFRTKYLNFASAGERLKWVKLRNQIHSDGAPNNTEGLISGDIAGKSQGAAGERRESVSQPAR